MLFFPIRAEFYEVAIDSVEIVMLGREENCSKWQTLGLVLRILNDS